MKTDLRVRESKKNKGKWEVVAVYEYYSGEVKRVVICERDSFEEAFKLIQ